MGCDRVQEVAIVAVVATVEHCLGCKDVAGVLSFTGPLVSIYSQRHGVLQRFALENWVTGIVDPVSFPPLPKNSSGFIHFDIVASQQQLGAPIVKHVGKQASS